jgi:hypothetical protein
MLLTSKALYKAAALLSFVAVRFYGALNERSLISHPKVSVIEELLGSSNKMGCSVRKLHISFKPSWLEEVDVSAGTSQGVFEHLGTCPKFEYLSAENLGVARGERVSFEGLG